jgi:hypothetical protein
MDVDGLNIDICRVEDAEMDERLRQAQPNCGVLLAVKSSKDGYGTPLTTLQEQF